MLNSFTKQLRTNSFRSGIGMSKERLNETKLIKKTKNNNKTQYIRVIGVGTKAQTLCANCKE